MGVITAPKSFSHQPMAAMWLIQRVNSAMITRIYSARSVGLMPASFSIVNT